MTAVTLPRSTTVSIREYDKVPEVQKFKARISLFPEIAAIVAITPFINAASATPTIIRFVDRRLMRPASLTVKREITSASKKAKGSVTRGFVDEAPNKIATTEPSEAAAVVPNKVGSAKGFANARCSVAPAIPIKKPAKSAVAIRGSRIEVRISLCSGERLLKSRVKILPELVAPIPVEMAAAAKVRKVRAKIRLRSMELPHLFLHLS